MSAPSTYGKHLFDPLPEIYRERDRTQPPGRADHLRNYLDSHGILLDRVRDTLEQLYADHFPDVPEEGQVCQSWIIPYLADLVGASPVSPFANGQRDEVANAIRWSKRKGTLVAVEEILETIALSEAEIQEAWRQVMVTRARTTRSCRPRTSAAGASDRYHSGRPRSVAPLHFGQSARGGAAPRHPYRNGRPAGTLARGAGASRRDRNRRKPVRHPLRLWPRDDNAPAVPPPDPIGWRQHEPHGTPCFPSRTRTCRSDRGRARPIRRRYGRYHPKSLIIHLPPPFGLCPPNPVTMSSRAKRTGRIRTTRCMLSSSASCPAIRRHLSSATGRQARPHYQRSDDRAG
jgi:hypothetical protein